MGQMLNALLGFDVAFRAWCNRAGRSAAAQELAKAGVEVRTMLAKGALSELAQTTDPKADFDTIVKTAYQAGLSWQDMAAAVNRAHEQNPGR